MTSPTTSPKRAPYVVGPGTFTVGKVGTELDMSCQLTEFRIEPEVDAEDSVPTLCGGTLAGDRVYSWTLAGTVAQDLETDGVVDFTWTNAGAQVPFSYTPDNADVEKKVTGEVIIDPLTLGGEVGKRGMSEFEWTVVGTPELLLPTGDTVPAG